MGSLFKKLVQLISGNCSETPQRGNSMRCPQVNSPADDGFFKEDFDKAKAAYDREDYAVSFSLFKGLAYEGCTEAYGYLGLAYELGLGVQRDVQEAESWYWKSIESKNHVGVYRLGMLYMDRGQDELAYGIYQRAIDGGFATNDDYFNVAKMLETGNGAKRDLQRAIEYYRHAMRSNDSFCARDAREALERLGVLYVREDFDMVLPAEVASESADRLYELGKEKLESFTNPDIPFAFVCLRNSADRGHALAACLLSRIYANGKYPICDKRKAKMYAETATGGMVNQVEQNPSYAYDAGYAYQSGCGCASELDKAIRCFQAGAQVMDKDCEWRLGLIFQNNGRDEDAYRLLACAAEHGQGMAMYEVAQCYEKGIGTSRDINKAIHWYKLCSCSHYAAESDAKRRLRELS